MGLHLATNIPVIISENLYLRVCVDGLLQKQKDSNGNINYILVYTMIVYIYIILYITVSLIY